MGNLNFLEIVGLLLLGLFIFGPERLPQVIGDAARMLRGMRQMARNATTELRDELGTDLDLEDLNPRTFVRKHLLSEEDEDRLTRPLRDAYRDVEDIGHNAMEGFGPDDGYSADPPASGGNRPRRRLDEGEQAPFDNDAT
ncbi:MAG: sec-independent protein translocase protein TatB [Actinomycetota bacterium]|jgi:sec-independent protein translocase protein TatB|nr:sec-independent protein translocase protein TatB [Cryptosporangiaceae bacterium]MDQ1678300.1 sec-independent protein translocase protein TatB [Actinomycetota bacterium]